jgi:hypothetical protein
MGRNLLEQEASEMSTALELSREEWQPYVEAAARRTSSAAEAPAEQRMPESLMEHVKLAFAAFLDALAGTKSTDRWAVQKKEDVVD